MPFLSDSLPLIFMALALSMDAFSVSLGLGMQFLPWRLIFLIGLVFGLFHVAFPILGILFGVLLSEGFGQIAHLLSGALLILVGFHMFFSAFSEGGDRKKPSFKASRLSIILLGITVSADSLPIGLSLGLRGVKTALALFFFGLFSTLFTWTGLVLGRQVKGFLHAYSELLGGSILLSFGLYLLFFS